MESDVEDAFPVVALVSSAGGLNALSRVLSRLQPSFPGAVVAMQHSSPTAPSRLAELIGRRTALPVRFAQDNDPLVPGHVLVIPPAVHMLIGTDAVVRLIKAGHIPPARPSADLLLCTLAVALGPRAFAAVLTGAGKDGALGARAMHAYGGHVVIQDEASSQAYGMPQAAAEGDSPGPPLPLEEIAEHLTALLHPWVGTGGPPTSE